MTTYTIADFRSGVVRTGLTARIAAYELLGYDGYEWEIVRDTSKKWKDGERRGYILHHYKNINGVRWTKSIISSHDEIRETAENEIFDRVIMSGIVDRDGFFCGPDENYIAAMLGGE